MPSNLRAIRSAVTWSAAVLVGGSILPAWERVERQDGCVVHMERVPVWLWLLDDRPGLPDVDRIDDSNHITCAALLAVASIIGALVYWVRRPRTRSPEAGDYQEGADGSIPDGRAPPG